MEEESVAIAGMPRRTKRWPDIPAAHPNAVSIERLYELIGHATDGFCVDGCRECTTLLAVRTLLLERYQVTELTVIPIGWYGPDR